MKQGNQTPKQSHLKEESNQTGSTAYRSEITDSETTKPRKVISTFEFKEENIAEEKSVS